MAELRTVAILYADAKGVYPSLPGCDVWDEARDARLYDGPHPTVCHPPCGPWAGLAKSCVHQSSDLAPLAVEQVRQWGGVLEHPSGSKLWARCRMPLPYQGYDAFGGFSITVEQVSWGHVARKRTWLYFVGVNPELVRSTRRWGGIATHWVSGDRFRQDGRRGTRPAHIKRCSDQQKRRTPPAFAEWLVSLARSVSLPSVQLEVGNG